MGIEQALQPAQGEQIPEKGSIGSTSDIEDQKPAPNADLHRTLQSRHMQLIAIGGTVGTGIFIASGTAISHAGPAGALIAYAFVGTLVYSVMLSLSEMATYLPIPGAFTRYAARFVDPSLGFGMGWLYWLSWAITYALELTAAGLIVQWWNDSLSIGIFITIFWIPITALNFLPVNVFAELEFWFASLKVVALIGFMIFGICVNAGTSPQGYIGFKYWNEPGAFAPYLTTGEKAKFVGFWAVLIQAGFSFQGTELVGIAAGESANPRKTVPKAVKNTFWSIFTLFLLTIFFIGILVPYTNEQLVTGDTNAGGSPLVIAAQLASVKALPSIINTVLLTVVLSAANSNVYAGSRILVGLSEEGCAPAFFQRSTNRGVPYIAVAFTAAFGLLGYMNLSDSGGKVFDWLLNITGVAGFIAWSCINICHIRFMNIFAARGISRDTLPFKSWGQPYLAWYGLVFCVIILFTQGFPAFVPWNTTNFFVAYISIIIFVALYLGHKIVTRSQFVNLMEADIDTGRSHSLDVLDAEEEKAKEGQSWWRSIADKLF